MAGRECCVATVWASEMPGIWGSCVGCVVGTWCVCAVQWWVMTSKRWVGPKFHCPECQTKERRLPTGQRGVQKCSDPLELLWAQRRVGLEDFRAGSVASWASQASLVAQLLKNPPTTSETWVRSLGWEDPLEKEKATHSSFLAWRIPWTIQSMGSQRVGHNWVTFTFTAASVPASLRAAQIFSLFCPGALGNNSLKKVGTSSAYLKKKKGGWNPLCRQQWGVRVKMLKSDPI